MGQEVSGILYSSTESPGPYLENTEPLFLPPGGSVSDDLERDSESALDRKHMALGFT